MFQAVKQRGAFVSASCLCVCCLWGRPHCRVLQSSFFLCPDNIALSGFRTCHLSYVSCWMFKLVPPSSYSEKCSHEHSSTGILGHTSSLWASLSLSPVTVCLLSLSVSFGYSHAGGCGSYLIVVLNCTHLLPGNTERLFVSFSSVLWRTVCSGPLSIFKLGFWFPNVELWGILDREFTNLTPSVGCFSLSQWCY